MDQWSVFRKKSKNINVKLDRNLEECCELVARNVKNGVENNMDLLQNFSGSATIQFDYSITFL